MNELFAKIEAWAIEKASFVELCVNEEQTKISLINPYLELLGFDVRNPTVVRLEFSTGIGKGVERVDYAVLHNDDPVILIEAKSATMNIKSKDKLHRIRRYAQDVPTVRYAALTNGCEWRWFQKNEEGRLADEPFIICDALAPKTSEMGFLGSISQDPTSNAACTEAENAKFLSQFSGWFDNLRNNPSDDVLRLVAKEVGWRWHKTRAGRMKDLFVTACQRSRDDWLRQRLDRAERDDPLPEPSPEKANDISVSRECWVEFPGDTRKTTFPDGTKLMLFVLQWCAEQDVDGPDAYLHRAASGIGKSRLLREKSYEWQNNVLAAQKEGRYSNEGYLGWRVFKNLDNTNKLKFIDQLLSSVVNSDRNAPVRGRDIDIWMPNAGLDGVYAEVA